jgi:hypothetical protein
VKDRTVLDQKMARLVGNAANGTRLSAPSGTTKTRRMPAGAPRQDQIRRLSAVPSSGTSRFAACLAPGRVGDHLRRQLAMSPSPIGVKRHEHRRVFADRRTKAR